MLLADELQLVPSLITKPNSADTWGLERASEEKLSTWMRCHLELAVDTCADPVDRETDLIARYAPPLNLTKCPQSELHLRISSLRSEMMARLSGSGDPPRANEFSEDRQYVSTPRRASLPARSRPADRFVGSDVDTAEAIAARFSLSPKSYRDRLRKSISWYRKPQQWTFRVGSDEWKEMITIAEQLAR